MEKQKLIASVISVTAVVGVLIVFVGIPAVQTHFHYERAYPAGETRHVWLRVWDFSEHVEVNVTFVDDPNLMYRIDVIQEIAGEQHRLIYQEPAFDPTVVTVKVIATGEERVESINIILGTGTPYDFSFDGIMNVTMVYDNNAMISPRTGDTINEGDADIYAECYGGTFTFIMTEDVQFNNTGMKVKAGTGTNLQLAIDLPEGMNGRLECPWEPLTYLVTDGWYLLSSGFGQSTFYGTISTSEPLLDIIGNSLGDTTIVGYLST
ncbi:MAG: hypothetical protein E4H14_17045 [Candidatus Thorarchaeota archaeon]|nr:MAG: hypothetical protein E4H14_17045 [Candidatus Thorarchaeota archaeon]